MENLRERDKIVFLSYFKGREDYFAQQFEDSYIPVNRALTEQYLEKHLNGFVTFGIYVLTKLSQCNFICIDIDIPKNELKNIKIEDKAKKYEYLKENLLTIQEIILKKLNIERESLLFEDTGGRGYHIWIFFEEAIPGRETHKLYYIFKKYADETFVKFEFFPKQSQLTEKYKYGNLIKLPLGMHQKYNCKSTFFIINDSSISYIPSTKDNIMHLQSVKKIGSVKIKKIIDNHEDLFKKEEILEIENERISQSSRTCYEDDLNFLFKNCPALNKLENKAEKNIELTNNEMFHFTNIILSIPNKEEFLLNIARKTYGTKFNLTYTNKEINLIKDLHPASCKRLISAGICRGYCNETIKEQNNDPLRRNTNPLSFWLIPSKIKSFVKNEELLDSISNIKNIKNAYWKLKKYHKYEDALFFDEFDFEQFEKYLDIYAEYISLYFQNKEKIPFIGYLNVNFPKNVNDDKEIQYRPMAYSTIYDQIFIQSIFNVVSLILEENFQDSSYGYRTNIDLLNTNDVFLDWREVYPRFRNNVLKTNRKSEVKYRIFCDISKFYDNINHDILIQQLQKYIKDDYVYSIVKDIVKIYKYEGQRNKGLPQGPAYARILANLYLNELDKEIHQYASGYYRYVDDMFLFFKDRKQAEEGLEKLMILLDDLDLKLSENEEKRPKIIETSKEEDLIGYLDSIKYGIFEDYKYIDIQYTEEEVQKFYKIVGNKLIPPNPQEIIEINKDIPSIIYLISKKFPFSITLKESLPLIINYLVENNIFFPKRLKSRRNRFIFYELIHLIYDNKSSIDLETFYHNLTDCHKIYFYLCLYYIHTKQDKYKTELKNITISNLKSSNDFLRGYAIMVAQKIELSSYFLNEDYLKDVLGSNSYFPKLKLFSCLNYCQLNEELQSLVRDYLKNTSNYIVRKCFLTDLLYENVGYGDNLFLSNLVTSDSYLLLPEICKIFINVKDKNGLFTAYAEILVKSTSYKKLSIEYLKSLLFDSIENSSKIALGNRIKLYDQIEDSELKRELNKIIEKKDNELDSAKEKDFKSRSYNDCFLREYLERGGDVLKYEELIPYDKLKKYQLVDISRLDSLLQDLSTKKVLPNIKLEFDSTKEEITLHYSKPEDFIEFNYDLFSNDEQGILKLFLVIDNLFKKAEYFFHIFHAIPLIKEDQILINPFKDEVLFKTFGTILCPRYTVGSSIIDSSDSKGIQKLISIIMWNATFKDLEQYEIFKKKSKAGIELFLDKFINRLSQEKTYSYARFHYLLNQIRSISEKVNCGYRLSLFYYYEQFKLNLFLKSQGKIDWLTICNSLESIYEEIVGSFDFIDFNEVDYKNKTFMNQKYSGNFHYLSIQLLNILLNVETMLKIEKKDCIYTNLVILLNYYTIFCIETICLIRIGVLNIDKTIKELPIDKKLKVKIDQYSYELNDEDIDAINRLIRLKDNKQNLFNVSIKYNLKQISTLFLLIFLDVSIKENTIFLGTSDMFEEKYCDYFCSIFFVNLPKIELTTNKYMQDILDDLKTNQHTVLIDSLSLEGDVLISCRNIHKILKILKVKRLRGGITHHNLLPIKIHLKSFFRKTNTTTHNSLEKIPLVSNCPTSSIKCSWDIYNSQVVNTVIPSNGIYKLITELKGVKIFGYKYFYSEKAKIIYDAIFSFIFMTLAAYSLLKTGSITDKQESNILLYYLIIITDIVFIGGAGIFLAKAINDLKYWSKELDSIIKHFKKE